MDQKPRYEDLEKRITELEQLVEQNQKRELQCPSDTFSFLIEAFHCIPVCKTFEIAAKQIFNYCKRLTGANSGYVALLSEDGEENEVLFLDAGGLPCKVDPNLPMPNRGLREIVYKTRNVVYENTFSESPWMELMPEGHVRLENVLFAPLNIENKTVGIIGIANKPGGFNEQDVHISKFMADLAAVALTYAKSQHQLKNSEELFRTTFEQAAVGIAQITPDGRFKIVNSKFADIIGYSKEELAKMSFNEITYPEDLNKERKTIDLVIKGEIDSFEIEKRYIQKSGNLIWIKLYSNVVRDKKNNIQYAVASVIDITERKMMETALVESKEKYRQITESMNEVFWLRSADNSEMLYVSPAYEKVWGRTCQSLYENPQSFIDSVYDEDKSAVFSELEKDMKGEGFDLEYRITRPDKGIRWIRAQSFPVKNNAGDVIKHTGIAMDITDRKRAEEALRENEKILRQVIDLVPHFIFAKDVQGTFLLANKAIAAAYGTTPENLLGKSDYDFSQNTDEVDFYVECDRKVIESGTGLYGIEETITDIKGSKRYLVTSKIPFTAFGKKNPAILGVSVDITDRKQAETEREKLHAQLHQAQKMESIGSLAGGIAHDFNNLLFPIVGLSEMMLNDFPPDSMERQNIQQIFSAGNRGRELVQQILSFSRQSEYQRIPIHIQKILKEVLKLCRSTIPADIAIKPDIQTDCAQVMADPTQIHQIAMNLITNAYHAMEPTGGTIAVKIKDVDFNNEDDPEVRLASGRYVVLSVTDTGTGIDPVVMSKIFDPYFTTKKKGKGTGLGLATVYGIVKAHGGEIKVHSEVGKGSSFHVYLPVLEKSASNIATDKQQQPLPTGTEHILLLDDEALIVQMEQQMLKRLGYRITSFSNSMDALAAFKTDPSLFDLIITDMSMPHMNGMQLAKKLIDIRPDIPIIICTGFSERVNKENSEAMGIKGLLMKPLVMKDLAKKVREVLDTMKELI